ncbi:MAG: protein phosphatase 2C domain-containing protein [Archangium sp.]|nr:protein phosphatase 2C domain-containing protein [Archangium sp.]
MFAATHIGRDHLRIGRNNQDGVFTSPRVAVVTDGCSSQPQSEVGAQLGARFLGQWLSNQHELTPDLPARATDALTGYLYQSVLALGPEVEPTLERYFLFTFLAAIRVGDRGMIFGLGDGAFLVDDELVRIDSGPDNAPPYCAYRLTTSGSRPEPQLHFLGPARRLAVMTDGFHHLELARLITLTTALTPNPLTLQRRLNVLAETERFTDDATIALLGS